MPSFELNSIGRVDFPANDENYWAFSLSRAHRAIEVDFNLDEGGMTKQRFNRIKSSWSRPMHSSPRPARQLRRISPLPVDCIAGRGRSSARTSVTSIPGQSIELRKP
jgi:hypothetical protein